MRCPSCNKFVPYDTDADPEEEGEPSVDEGGRFTASYRRVLPCADCGEELKEATIEFDEEIKLAERCKRGRKEHEFELESCDATPTTDVVRKDRNGRTIKSARYMKTLYGVEVTVVVKCVHCDKTVEETFAADEQASAFEELV